MDSKKHQLEIVVLRSPIERKLFKLYQCLDNYFYVRNKIDHKDIESLKYLSNTGYYNLIGNITPLFYQCLSWFWLNRIYCKSIKIKF